MRIATRYDKLARAAHSVKPPTLPGDTYLSLDPKAS
jgi:hypothetical protein